MERLRDCKGTTAGDCRVRAGEGEGKLVAVVSGVGVAVAVAVVRVAVVMVLVLSSSGTYVFAVVGVMNEVTCLEDGCHSARFVRMGEWL